MGGPQKTYQTGIPQLGKRETIHVLNYSATAIVFILDQDQIVNRGESAPASA